MPVRDVFFWNTLIRGYSDVGPCKEAILSTGTCTASGLFIPMWVPVSCACYGERTIGCARAYRNKELRLAEFSASPCRASTSSLPPNAGLPLQRSEGEHKFPVNMWYILPVALADSRARHIMLVATPWRRADLATQRLAM